MNPNTTSLLGRFWNRITQPYLSTLNKRRNKRLESAESLEDRILLTTRLFLDLGEGLFNAPLTTTVTNFRNIDGAATAGTGSDLVGIGGMVGTSPLTFSTLNYDWDNNGTFELADVQALSQAVLEIAVKEAEPLDIEVLLASSTSLADASTTLRLNDTGGPDFDGFGENDAYNFIANITSTAIPANGGSVGEAGGLFGIAAASDLITQTGNRLDEATLTFADVVLRTTFGTPGTAQFNANLAHRIAYTAVHEANHTYTLSHTDNASLLTRGDAIRLGSDTREDRNIYTNFPLPLAGGGIQNTYGKLASDADIGFRDDNRNGTPDFAYVTGTGANDRITITDNGDGTAQVEVLAYNASQTYLEGWTYNIDLASDTDGLIIVDGSVNEDTITIDTNIAANFEIRGHLNEDNLILTGTAANDITYNFGVDDQHEITIVRGATSQTIMFDEELELVTDNLVATNRTFSAMDVGATLTHNDSATTDFVVTSSSAIVEYALPTSNLTLESQSVLINTVQSNQDLVVAGDLRIHSTFGNRTRLGDSTVTGDTVVITAGGNLIFDGWTLTNGLVTLTGGNITFNDEVTNNGGFSEGTLTVNTGTDGVILFDSFVGSGQPFARFATGTEGTTIMRWEIVAHQMDFYNRLEFDPIFATFQIFDFGIGSGNATVHGEFVLGDTQIDLTGNLIFAAGSEILWEVNGTTPGTGGYGQIINSGGTGGSSGDIIFDTTGVGVAFTVLNATIAAPNGTQFNVVTSSGIPTTGILAGLPDGATFFDNGFSGEVTYPSNNVVLTARPAPPAINLTPVLSSINENTVISAPLKVADITIVDLDGIGTNNLSLSGPDAGLFSISGNELFLNAGAVLDFEVQNSYSVVVEVDDPAIGNNPDETETFILTINNINEVPVLSIQNLVPVPEDLNTTTRNVIADINTLDILGTHVFTITGPDAGLVEVIGNDPSNWKLAIRAGAALDFETNPTLDFTINVDDTTLGVNPDSTLPVSLNVIDVNEPPTVQLINRLANLNENVDTTNRIKVADIQVSDDAISSRYGSINPGVFTEGNVLIIGGGGNLLREYTMDGTLVQSIPVNRGKDFVIDVNGILHFTDDGVFRTFDPNTVTTTDIPLHGWSTDIAVHGGVTILGNHVLIADMSNNPAVDPVGIIRIDINDPENWERIPAASMFDLVVGQDGLVYGLSKSTAVNTGGTRIHVFDPETLAEIRRFSVPEIESLAVNEAGHIFGALRRFGATADGVIELRPDGTEVKRLDLPGFGGKVDIDLTNNGQSMIITSHGGDFVVVDTALTTWSRHGLADTDIAFGTIVQPPFGSGAIQLTLSGTDAGLFEIIGNELYLRAGVSLDFETNPALDVTIEVDDSGVGSTPDDTDSMQIAIGDINEAPTGLTAANVVNPISEGTDVTAAVRVADLVIIDDALGTNVLTLSGADAGLFEVQGTQLFLRAGASLDFETQPVLNVTVTLDDASVGATRDATLNLIFNISDFNEVATVTLTQVKSTVNEFEDTTSRIKVADIAITDDALGTNTLSLTGTDASKFEIVGMELYLRIGATFDFETNPLLDVIVNVDDPGVVGTPDDTASLVVTVIDQNDVPGVHLANTQLTILESPTPLSPRFKVGDIVIDDDALGTNALRLTGTDRRFFEIDNNVLYLKAGTLVDFETLQSYDVNVEVNDTTVGSDPFDAREKVRLTVLNVNDPPVIAPATFTIAENSFQGLVVGSIPVTDRDPGDTHTFSLIGSGNVGGAFAINPTTGTITVANPKALDFETRPTFTLTVSVRDNGSPQKTANATVTVNLINRTEGDAVLWNPVTQTLTIATGNGSSFSFASDANSWSGFDGQFFLADVNGEGGDDIIAVGTDGIIMVALNNGNGFEAPTQFGAWAPAFIGSDLNVGDFNGDGNADLIARGVDGRWRYQLSRETSFTLKNAHLWGSGYRDGDAVVLDYDGDGFDDIALVQSSGQWFVGFGSAEGNMDTQYVGRWSTTYTWSDLRTGNFDSDSRGDIIARTNLGHWYQLSTIFGTRTHVMTYLDSWNPSVSYNDVTVADFDGDGIDDFGAWNSLGYWFINKSSGNFTTQEQFGRWNPNATWQVTTADLDGNGADDILGFDEATGNWWALLSHPTESATTIFFGTTAPTSNTQLLGGEFK